MQDKAAEMFPKARTSIRAAYEAGARTADPERPGRVLPYEEPNMFFGGVNAVRLTTDGKFEAAADPRRSGGVSFA